MKTRNISRLLHAVVFLSFFLPFFYTGCGPTAEEKAAMEKATEDSIAYVKKHGVDTVAVNNLKKANTDTTTTDSTKTTDIQSVDTSQSLPAVSDSANYPSEGEKQITDDIVEKYPWLSFLLKPSPDTYSGIGTFVNLTGYLMLFSLFISILLLIISLLIKFIEPASLKSIVVLELLMLGSLALSHSSEFISERLWGFWVCLALSVLLTIYDLYLLIIPGNNKS